MRKLASIQKVESVQPIEGADRLDLARVLGWQLVVRKGEFQSGELAIYCEIDSFLPIDPRFEYLRKSCYKKLADGTEGFRIRTIKLRGQISQGLLVHVSQFPDVPLEIGADVTNLLGIRKYEPPAPASLEGEVKGPFPGFIFKTDETRIQSVPGVLDRHRGKQFCLTEKLDGSSGTFYKHQGKFGVCGRNWEYQETPGNTFWQIARRYGLPDKLPDGFAVQGEVIGEGIQGNPYKLIGQDLYVFQVLDIARSAFLGIDEMAAFCGQIALKTVPRLETITLDHTVDELVALAGRPSVLNPQTPAEGIVCRPLTEERDVELERLSFKVVNPHFLLKYEQ